LDKLESMLSCWLPWFSGQEVATVMATTESGIMATTNGATKPYDSAAELAISPAITATRPLPKVA
jgi:hypothetical protein